MNLFSDRNCGGDFIVPLILNIYSNKPFATVSTITYSLRTGASGAIRAYLMPPTVRPATLRFHWFLVSILTLVLLAGVLASRGSSSATRAPLRLVPGESVTISVFRPLPAPVHVSLDFARPNGATRAELGSFINKPSNHFVEFDEPGAPVIIQVEAAAKAIIHEALPAGSSSAESITRELVVRDLDGNPSRFRWPPDNSARLLLPAGKSTVKISVLEVGSLLAGEQVTAVIQPPLSFKSAAPGYDFLWWFFFWPVLAAPLAIYAAVLLWFIWRARGHPKKSINDA